MNLYRYYEAKKQNDHTIKLLSVLDRQKRLSSLPGAIGEHYRKIDIDKDEEYIKDHPRDRYIYRLLTCSDSIQGYLAKNGDFSITGAKHCRQSKLCACCGTGEARRVSSQLRFLFLKNKDKHYRYFMYTLTLPNNFDGFREEFKIYDRSLRSINNYLGFNGSGDSNAIRNTCKGYFAARELTYSKNKGFHPHIHVIIAYDEKDVSCIEKDRFGAIKNMYIHSKRGKSVSAFSIREVFVENIKKINPDYYIQHTKEIEKGLNIDFREIVDIDNSCDEICKYFIDYNSFKDVDSLYIYLRDIYNLHKYSKQGCFGWSKDLEDEWRTWCKLGKPGTQNLHFISLAEQHSINERGFINFGLRIGVYNGNCILFPAIYHKSELVYDHPISFSFNRDTGLYTASVYTVPDEVGRLGYLRHITLSPKLAHKLLYEPRDDITAHINYWANDNIIDKNLIEGRKLSETYC